jgi:hypothetical protein
LPSSASQPIISLISTRITARRALFLALAGAFLVVLLTASSLSAAGGDIKVVTTGEDVNFPGNVDLSVTAEGDADIVEVRLFYRTVGSRVWAYAYPDFVPASRITASLNLTGEVSTYLPPGTEVEYYYEIRDAQGNVLRTEPTVVEYEDTRFDWSEFTVGPLTVRYYDQSESRVSSVAQDLESDMARLQSLLQIEQPDPIKGVIYSRRSHTLDAFPQQSRTTTEQQTFQGFAFPERSLFLGLGLDRGLIVHESAHLLLAQALGTRVQSIPAWLDEGFASYMDPSVRIYSGESLKSRTNPLRAMNTLTGTPHNIGTFYQKSLSVVAFLIDEFGQTSFQQLTRQLSDGGSIGDSLTNVYGFDVDGLDDRWSGQSLVSEPPAPSAPVRTNPGSDGSTAILFFNSWLLGGLMLLVTGALSIQFIASKLRPATNPEEGLQPWEDPDLWDDDDEGPY